MGSNNYAEQITRPEEEQILADLKKVKLFHLYVTEKDKGYWGKGGMDIEQLECSLSTVESQSAQGLWEMSDFLYDVNFGNGYRGWCFQIRHMYVWLAPVQESHRAYKIMQKANEAARESRRGPDTDGRLGKMHVVPIAQHWSERVPGSPESSV